MIAFAYVNASGSLQNGRPPPCFPDTCPSLGYYAVLVLAGFFIAMYGAIVTISAFLIRPGYFEYQTGPILTPQPGSGPEDENILAMARELQLRVKRPKFGKISGIAWSEALPWYETGWIRGFRKPLLILLPADLRGRLDGEEWKTLLNYYYFAQRPGVRAFMILLLPVLMAIFLPLLVVGTLISMGLGPGAAYLYVRLIAGPIVLIGFILVFPTAKWLLLRNDRRIARQVGSRPLLEVFKRIDSLQLPRVENAKKRHGWTKRLWPMPNITERIQNLTDGSPS
jgi:hypothetical protein